MSSSNQVSGSMFQKAEPARILRSELNQMIEMLHASDASMVKFGQALSEHPAVLKQVLRAANSSLTGSTVEITEPAHASLYLGTRRVIFLLNTLPPEIIEEDLDEEE